MKRVCDLDERCKMQDARAVSGAGRGGAARVTDTLLSRDLESTGSADDPTTGRACCS